MGQAQPVARRPVPMDLVSLKEHTGFKDRYTESGRLPPRGGSLRSMATRSPQKGMRLGMLLVKGVESGLTYACRQLPKARIPCSDPKAVEDHLRAMGLLEHPHICKFVEAFSSPAELMLIYELADEFPFLEHEENKERMAEPEVAAYTRQLTSALLTAHRKGVCHGHLSPAQVLTSIPDKGMEFVPRGWMRELKICDVGQAFILKPLPIVGDLEYRKLMYCAPEFVWEEVGNPPVWTGFRAGATEKENAADMARHKNEVREAAWRAATGEGVARGAGRCDVWALGVLVFQMLTGSPPFMAHSREELMMAIQAADVFRVAEGWRLASDEARGFVMQCLVIGAGLRKTMKELLAHNWLKRAEHLKLGFRNAKLLLHQLRAHVRCAPFRRLVIRVIASQLDADSEERRRAEHLFRTLDKNGDGLLSVKEFTSALRRRSKISEKMGHEDLERIFFLLDRGDTDTVNIDEFVAATIDARKSPLLQHSETLWKAFHAFDKSGEGDTNLIEVEHVIREMEGGVLAREQVDELVLQVKEDVRPWLQGKHKDWLGRLPEGLTDEILSFNFHDFMHMMAPRNEREACCSAPRMKRSAIGKIYDWFGLDLLDVREKTVEDAKWRTHAASAKSVYAHGEAERMFAARANQEPLDAKKVAVKRKDKGEGMKEDDEPWSPA